MGIFVDDPSLQATNGISWTYDLSTYKGSKFHIIDLWVFFNAMGVSSSPVRGLHINSVQMRLIDQVEPERENPHIMAIRPTPPNVPPQEIRPY